MKDNTVPAGAALVGRLLLAALFVIEGWGKVQAYGPALSYMRRYGVPGELLPLVIAAELGGGLLLAIGWQARWAAMALAAFCVAAAVLFHTSFADRNQLLHFEKDLAIAGGLLVVFAFGPGRWSLTGLMEHRRRA
jgi:putative oxidoreductase